MRTPTGGTNGSAPLKRLVLPVFVLYVSTPDMCRRNGASKKPIHETGIRRSGRWLTCTCRMEWIDSQKASTPQREDNKVPEQRIRAAKEYIYKQERESSHSPQRYHRGAGLPSRTAASSSAVRTRTPTGLPM
jgi:hypothetical protein